MEFKKLSKEDRITLKKGLTVFVEPAKKELEQFEKIDERLQNEMKNQSSSEGAVRIYLKMILPNQEIIKSRKEQIEQLERQIELLDNPEVENMNEEEFINYFKG